MMNIDSLENSQSSQFFCSHSPIFSMYFFTYSQSYRNFLTWRVSRSKMQSRFQVDQKTMQHTCCRDSEGSFFIIWPRTRFQAGLGRRDQESGWQVLRLTGRAFFRMPGCCCDATLCSPNWLESAFLTSLLRQIFIRQFKQFSRSAASLYQLEVFAQFLQIIRQKSCRSAYKSNTRYAQPPSFTRISISFKEISLYFTFETFVRFWKTWCLRIFQKSLGLVPEAGSLGDTTGKGGGGGGNLILGSYQSSLTFYDLILVLTGAGGSATGTGITTFFLLLLTSFLIISSLNTNLYPFGIR